MDVSKHATERGVLSHLMMLETAEAMGLTEHNQDSTEELRATLNTLRAQVDQLKSETESLGKLKIALDRGLQLEDWGEACGTSLLQLEQYVLTARKIQLQDLQKAHHLIGGYDLMELQQGKAVCVSFHTAYEGVLLETYNMELDLTKTLRINRHNVPPSIPLEQLAKQSLQTDFKAFLQSLSQHLNAFAGRRQQICLIKELIGTVTVMESNPLYNILVLMCKAQGETDTAVLCTLEYGDLGRCLPTHVLIEAEDKTLPESPQWKKNRALLLESPVHTALLAMRRLGSIV